MGMAASQARLLMITSRLHDVELKAQQLENAKVQLSTQQDEVYQNYQKALDATTLTFTSIDLTTMNKTTVSANFKNLFSINRDYAVSGHLILLDSRGRVVIDDETAQGLEAYTSYWGGDVFMDNAYQFALFMVEGQRYGHQVNSAGGSDMTIAIDDVFEANNNGELKTLYDNAVEALNQAYPGGAHGWHNNGKLSQVLMFAQCDLASPGYTAEQKEALNELVNYFWSHHANAVFSRLDMGGENIDNEDYNSTDFNYYVEIYNAIKQHGYINDHDGLNTSGYISISDYNGLDGSAATDSDWLTAMLQSGQMSIESIKIDGEGNALLNTVSISADQDLTYTATSQIDKRAMARAETEYEHELDVINRKEDKIDLELNKIETERNALTKEYDSIKKVSDDNVERTFGIFS